MNKRIPVMLTSALFVALSASAYAGVANNGNPDQARREASEGPRGGDHERPGDRQRRGGRGLIDQDGFEQLVREASEGPRGGDHERPGDRQRRGGRG